MLRGALAIAVVLMALHNGAASPTSAQARERVAYVSVVDSKTLEPLRDWTARDIVVREDGVTREVLSVTPARSPMPVALIVDNSQAAMATIPDLRHALTAFVQAIDGLGPAAVFTVADRPTILQEYTTSGTTLLQSIGRLFHSPSSGATLLDTIAEVSKGLLRRESDRAAIVVVTGENVEYGNLHYGQVLERLRESGAMLSAIVLTNSRGSLDTEEGRNRATVLDRAPRETGGMRRDVLTSMSFESQLKVVGEMLKSQFRVTYARPESLIQPERVQIAAAKPGFEAHGGPARRQDK
jgi:hypothetical protein